jgi:hypothetical protein
MILPARPHYGRYFAKCEWKERFAAVWRVSSPVFSGSGTGVASLYFVLVGEPSAKHGNEEAV